MLSGDGLENGLLDYPPFQIEKQKLVRVSPSPVKIKTHSARLLLDE
jgi:hypothetical protein